MANRRVTLRFTEQADRDIATIREDMKAKMPGATEPTETAIVLHALFMHALTVAAQSKPAPKPPAKARRRPR